MFVHFHILSTVDLDPLADHLLSSPFPAAISISQEMELLPVSLQFLPPTKQREVDSVLRLTCVEILLLLATSASFLLFSNPGPNIQLTTYVYRRLFRPTALRGRQQLRARGAYTVIKFAHKVEPDNTVRPCLPALVRAHRLTLVSCPSFPPLSPQNAEQMHRLVNLLQREEGPETKIEELGPEDADPEEEDEEITEV